ncbi:MAG: HAD-IA family hydrolase [Candidatus Cloacimonadaceae bacterium]|jgi:phosphoglycolate phosphatase|nr:HAD-IA family hydrolase [Candidatus Cloacimonadota bacterium]MDX9950411.1 HAD-IA family hydrolase [Candidatus Syntrophosphaera sp.]
MKPTLICDFDGTLADSISAILDIINNLAPRYGFRGLDHEHFEKLRDLPFRKAAREMDFPIWKLGQAITLVLQEYRHIIHSLKPYPGIVSALKELSSGGIGLGLVSSNNTDNLHSFLSHHNIGCFDWVEGTHGILRKHRSIKDQIKKHGLKKENTLYIGDEVRDIKAARRSGIKVISVTWGLHSRQNLQKHKPDWLIDHPEELLDLIPKILPQAQIR